MHISHLKISNYKSFFKTTEFCFEPGFNILLGANSSGKSTVLEAIALHELVDTPHLSTLNSDEPGDVPTDRPASELTISIMAAELRKLAHPVQDFYIGIGDSSGHFYSHGLEQLQSRLNDESLVLSFKRDLSAALVGRMGFQGWSSVWRSMGGGTTFPALHMRDMQAVQIANFGAGADEINQIWQKLPQKIYRFSSERNVKAICSHYPSSDLLSSSENLAYCINHLQSNNSNLFEKLNRLLNRIFPTIHWIAAPPTGTNQFELRVHSTPTHLDRGDLAVPISRVGTGIGNAIAMLYVALTAQTQRFILLEEPNSFLHPRALRELLSILAEVGGKHQFFVTTHSSDVLRTVDASTVTLLEHDGQQTTIKQTTGKKLHELKAGLVDLGISLTDLHGCDKVLWVEGETEEAVFPQLLRKYFPEQAQGIAVLPLHATGDFESKKFSPQTVAEIYKRLSEGSFLAPPMVAIALDKERRRVEQIEQIETDCAGIVHFLPQTMLEDYLLHPEAIRTVLNENLNSDITEAAVAEALANAQQNDDCRLNPKNPKSTTIHAAKVLNTVFLELGTLEYHKTAHGPQIVEWLLTNAPDHLAPLKEWLTKVMQGNT
jgi:ABC-type cobalamin/Fe3+-siderophores transport system ATPase subunit